MKAAKYNATGTKTGEVNLPESLFGGEVSKGAIYTVIRAVETNRRQGTHKTRGFSEVHGGGKKPYRQKGTGNARQGSIRAAQYRGGFTVFGPQPRDYSINLPDKQKRAGIRNIFADKAQKSAVSVMSPVELKDFSTKSMNAIFVAMGLTPGNTVTYIVHSDDIKLKKSVMNLSNVTLLHAERVTAPELFYNGHLVISEDALDYLEKAYGKKSAKVGG